MFNCIPAIKAICMLVTIHLRSASQQHLVIALMTLSTIEIHMVPYKYTHKTFLQFPYTLAGESPKWNILVVTWALVIYLKYALALGLLPRARAYILGKLLVPMLQLLHKYSKHYTNNDLPVTQVHANRRFKDLPFADPITYLNLVLGQYFT